jgi:hypothetical protein
MRKRTLKPTMKVNLKVLFYTLITACSRTFALVAIAAASTPLPAEFAEALEAELRLVFALDFVRNKDVPLNIEAAVRSAASAVRSCLRLPELASVSYRGRRKNFAASLAGKIGLAHTFAAPGYVSAFVESSWLAVVANTAA